MHLMLLQQDQQETMLEDINNRLKLLYHHNNSLKDLINLLDKSLLHTWVDGKVVGEGGEGAGGCLEAGEQEDD